ncbi:glycoside hydrolase family 61 protein [Ceratobasidium sp. AG-Ba]|nr:glycoside hydrolase family 61 protein [Ceratobasidium sp. AG-Ba]
MLYSSILSIFALAAAGANAHGYVAWIVADGKKYVGGVPGETHPDSPIRSISTINPYKDPKGPGQTCGLNAKAGKLTATVTAGSTLDLSWAEHKQQAWPHELGPLITYMAKVPAGKTAATVDPATLDFFKIQQTGQKTKGGLKWFVEDQMKLNTKYSVKVPLNLADGDYMMRHEIIALHLADKKGGAEFYASCFQLKVTGGTGSGSPGPTAKFPGAYSATDKGIFTPGVFDKGFNYQFPGPALFSGASNLTTPSAPKPAAPITPDPTDDDEEDCEEEPETTSIRTSTKTATSKRSMPTGDMHNGYKRSAWSRRMEKRYVGRASN